MSGGRDEGAELRAWLEGILAELHRRYGQLHDGALADYIPELGRVDPTRFAIAAMTTDGDRVEVGDCGHHFTVQSISKLLVYGLALEIHGRETVLERIGVAPTGERFNAIVLDEADNRAPNPMVNAGAIAAADLIRGDGVDQRIDIMLDLFERYLGRRPDIDQAVFGSERATGDRNRAIAYLMLSRGILDSAVDDTLDLYFAQCSVLVTAADLATIGAIIANHGTHPQSGQQIIEPTIARDMMTIALTCGMYDYAGEWAYTIGIPAKSGVGGGILGVLPGAGGLATFSPRLDQHGHSVRGVKVFEELSNQFDLHLFDPDRPWYR